MKAEEIRDRPSLESWLKPRAVEDAKALAARSALRVMPVWTSALSDGWVQETQASSISLLRQVLTISVARRYAGQGTIWDQRPFVFAETHAKSRAGMNSGIHTGPAANAAIMSTYAYVTEDSGLTFAHAMDYAVKAASFSGGSSDIWEQVREDARMIEAGQDPASHRLWSTPHPDWFTVLDRKTREIWSRDPDTWSFWLRWWDGILAGNQLDWDLQRQVALIPDAIWSHEPADVAEAIRRIESAENRLDTDLRRMPAAPAAEVQAARAAMERNRQSLPPTFDAIEGLLLLEIERLQRSNDRDEEWSRQMNLFLSLHEAVTRLRATLLAEGPVTAAQAETSERLLRLYARKLSELPRARVDDVVEGVVDTARGVVQVGLIGTTALLGMAYGLPALAGVAIGSMIFAPKNAADLIKAAREAVSRPGP